MLKSLYIKNYTLIDNLEIDFSSGFSVITGETGAGKSIILGALSLILGQRADTKSIKAGENKCIIEGVFDVSGYNLKNFCDENGIEYDPQSYILRREILSSGKSRAFLNDSPVSLSDLRLIGELLIDIHSQHKNLLLGDNHFQLQIVDILAGNKELLKKYRQAFRDYKSSQKQLDDLIETAQKNKEEEDYLRFQFDTLSEANLIEEEQELLETELQTLNHAEDIKTALFKVQNLLSGDENGIIGSLKEAVNTVQGLSKIYAKSEEFIERLQTAYIDLKDLSPEIERTAEDIEFNPNRSALIQERLDRIYSLQQKYKVSSVGELIDLLNDLRKKIDKIESYDEQIELLQKETEKKKYGMLSLADKLTKQRKSAIKEIEKQLIAKVSLLGMPNARFECEITPKNFPDISGGDNLKFLFSANKNVPLQPISEVASGGEISRVMLSLKSMIAGATTLPTIIFDEIDSGVSGEIAYKMGNIMQDFGNKMQVIAITHLPQIAAKGSTHYYVFKKENKDKTSTNIRQLETNERIMELAQMLSGSEITEAAIQNAKEMLTITK